MRKKKGFTLVELMIFMGMFSILLVVFSQIFGQIVDTRLESESHSSVVQDGNYLLNRLMYDIVIASGINLPATVGSSDTNLNITVAGEDHIYSLSGDNLVLIINSDVYQLNSVNTTISNLNFQRIGNDDGKDTIRYSYTVTSKIDRPAGPESQDYQTTVGLR